MPAGNSSSPTSRPIPSRPKPPLENENWVTVPLPREPVPIGHTWSIPQEIDVPLEGGIVKRVKAIQQFTLEEVKTGVATIRFSTDILTPVTDPVIESQLVQRESMGKVRLDIDEGRILSQQIDIDKHVVGFRGDASSIHYVNRFSERLAPGAQDGGKTEPPRLAWILRFRRNRGAKRSRFGRNWPSRAGLFLVRTARLYRRSA